MPRQDQLTRIVSDARSADRIPDPPTPEDLDVANYPVNSDWNDCVIHNTRYLAFSIFDLFRMILQIMPKCNQSIKHEDAPLAL